MINIIIDNILKEKCPNLTLGCIIANVKVNDFNEDLWKEITNECNNIETSLEIKDILTLENIKASRDAYKKFKKDPSKYRLSSESLLRRIVKGLGLYKVNTIVDINNLISLKTNYSVGTYDLDKLNGDILFTLGHEGERYEGIGRGEINLENLPVFEDAIGKFGSTTSDSTRAMITKDTKSILMNIISFNGDINMESHINNAKNLLELYSDAKILETRIIK